MTTSALPCTKSNLTTHNPRGEERVKGNGNLRESRGVYVSLLCFVCSLSGPCLSPVFRFLFAVLSIDLNCRLLKPTVFREWGGLSSPEGSMTARVIAYGAWRRETMFMYLISGRVAVSYLQQYVQCWMWSLTFHTKTLWTNWRLRCWIQPIVCINLNFALGLVRVSVEWFSIMYYRICI